MKQLDEKTCEHGVLLVGGFCDKCVDVMCREAVKGPGELEMHRLAHQMCKDAGFEGPEEALAAYKTAETKVMDLTEKLEDMRRDLSSLWGIAAKHLLVKP